MCDGIGEAGDDERRADGKKSEVIDNEELGAKIDEDSR